MFKKNNILSRNRLFLVSKDSYGNAEEKKNPLYEMMETIDKFSLVQAMQEPTRKENTLDLVFTNYVSIFAQVDVTDTIMSEHDIVEIITNLDDNGKYINKNKVYIDTKENYLQQLNFHNKDIPWLGIKQIIMELEWPKLFKEKNVFGCTQIFLFIIKMIRSQLIPKKNNEGKERKKMFNRIKMLKRKRHNIKKQE